ncbi:hypothetical protein Pcinc_034922 [Petrolisthes cinctipes]|uniref:Uncharacterized protein n=1 Tax=Petrolisthes cinctipes TaxID=88211 RepID=A0AAE1BXK5_PETCI|nr:hypothetical protein Pcinc_034922 [Petrolisthes cinctipes]
MERVRKVKIVMSHPAARARHTPGRRWARGVYKARGRRNSSRPYPRSDFVALARARHPNSATAMCVQMSSDSCVRRRRFVRVLKPLLPRKLTSSARINLNRHWNELEELYGSASVTSATTRATHFEALALHNELNDNALNEAREAAAAASAVKVIEADPVAVVAPTEEDCLMLTPPSTPTHSVLQAFNFPPRGLVVMEDDDLADDLPLTPNTPRQAWDVFAFPPVSDSTSSSSSSEAPHHH